MKKLLIILSILCLSLSSVTAKKTNSASANPKFETAVALIKKYETLHKARNWPYVGYGHRVLPGDHFKRGTVLSEPQADRLLRQDLEKYCEQFSEFGKDSLLLGVIAYNVGTGRVSKSRLAKLLRHGNRNIRTAVLDFSRYHGRIHPKIHARRIEEFEALFVK